MVYKWKGQVTQKISTKIAIIRNDVCDFGKIRLKVVSGYGGLGSIFSYLQIEILL